MQEFWTDASSFMTDPNLAEGEDFIRIHRVTCDAHSHREHARHPKSQDYLDAPRLLAGVNRTTPLQGQQRMQRLEWYLEDHPEVSFAVLEFYDCYQYHREVADEFKGQRMPVDMEEVTAQAARPYFSVLRKDARTATPYQQTIIPSKELRKGLIMLQADYPDELHDWNEPNNLQYPYFQLYHCIDLLSGRAARKLSALQRKHVGSLARYLRTILAAQYQEAEEDLQKGVVKKKHWARLYRPNDVVLTKVDGEELAYLSTSCPIVAPDSLTLNCWSWKYDGKFYRQSQALTIKWPSNTATAFLSDLSCYPLRLDQSNASERLSKRGSTFWKCRTRRYVDYEMTPELGAQATKLRFMVDTNTYKLLHPTNADHEVHQELDPAAMDNDDPPADPFPLLLPAKIRGYGFHDKKWSELLVRQISDIEWNSTAFESKLVLDTDKKDLIEALVANHSERRLTMKSDFLAGKGEGLLILLHGGPGTGKTLTAETVAELAMKPLYRVTCGDIGTKPEAVESYLESVLFIGSRWNCVVLLDEADVFLEERSKLDLERNALVSVFLRVLEYYDGILILTSNRIGTFDEAFKSRVQLSLHYPPLTAGNRLKVWENFITLLEEEDKTLDYTDIRSSLTSLAQHKLNGRQIRNTLNTARQLAQFKDEKLRYRHIEQAIRNVVDFENYITRLHDGESDEERAEAAGIRHNKKRKIEDCSR